MRSRYNRPFILAATLGLLVASLAACSPTSPQPAAGAQATRPLKVVATTTIVGDVVRQIGGEDIQLVVLLQAGADPHTFEPAPQDLTAVADADAIFISGAGLELFLDRFLNSAGSGERIVDLSDGIQLRELADVHADEDEAHEADSEGVDPHVWYDPNNVIIWTQNTERALTTLNPANAGLYAENAAAYRKELQELDDWIREQVSQVPEPRRKLVTDHQIFGYFAERYGFEQVGAVIPGFSTASAPSAQELAALEDTIRKLGVNAIFVGNTVNPNLAQRVAEDTGIRLVFLYTDALTAPGGEADTYLKLMRYNVNAIVAALK